ncbi:MAG: hypothetical protein K8L97_23810 [Anaerolineae bacterium]|nr:hypothetical protein [Anaerolineae bacterium]
MKANARKANRLFSPRSVLLIGIVFVALIIISNRLATAFCASAIGFDCPIFWPISEMSPRIPQLWQVALGGALLIGIIPIARFITEKSPRLLMVIGAGLLLVLGTTIMQGWYEGFAVPMVGLSNAQYYGDAVEISDPLAFVQDYTDFQAGLRPHARVHPPGATLFIYTLNKLLGSSEAISVVIALLAVPFTAFLLYRLLAPALPNQQFVKGMVFLWALIPSVQVYYASTVDALIAGLLLGAMVLLIYHESWWSGLLIAVLIWIVSFLTFLWVFILPVLLGYEVFQRRTIWRTALTVAFIGLVYLLMNSLLSFNYLESFSIASKIDNPRGFMLLANPARYFLTRLESVAEILVFFGPFLTILLWRGLPILRQQQPKLFTFTLLGLASMLLLLGGGVFQTGETARVCLFLIPYLFLPVVAYLKEATPPAIVELMFLVFAQAIFMQLFGIYVW